MDNTSTKKVVIIGGGFGGVNLARYLSKDKNFDIVLVDKNNYNFFPPLIYQVATGFLETASISYPFRKLFRKKNNVHFQLGCLLKVDTFNKICELDTGRISYEYLVFATGAETNYFGNENVKKNAIPMKTINDALHMRNSLLLKLEEATQVTDIAERTKMLSIVVAGGGPTGVEVAGMLAELRKYVLKKDYPELVGSNAGIYLLEGGPKLLGPMSAKSHEDAYKALTKLGVDVRLNSLVKDYSDGKVTLSTGEIIEAGNMIWTAGVSAVTFEGIPAESIGPGKRMLVNEFNAVKGLQDVYAIGDACLQTTDPNWPKGHPQLAQTAIQQGRTLAKNLIAGNKGKEMKPFSYYDKGSMAIVGRSSAVCDIPKPKLHFNGVIALFMWLFVHLIGLINPSNKIRTFFNWTTAYLTRDQSLRMIVRPERKKKTDPVT